MRKYKRYMAKKNMEKRGVRHYNRRTGRAPGPDGTRTDSYFALNWRDWVTV